MWYLGWVLMFLLSGAMGGVFVTGMLAAVNGTQVLNGLIYLVWNLSTRHFQRSMLPARSELRLRHLGADIREHLRLEADRFRRGDFTDPTRIHGTAMPGLEPLKGSAGRIGIAFAETSGGARITYTTVDATLVTALHAWFDAQVSDHGAHATGG